MNCGGRNHGGIVLERQIVKWATSWFNFPVTAQGLFVTGSSMANFMSLLAARTAALGAQVRTMGIVGHSIIAESSAIPDGAFADKGGQYLRVYTSMAAHCCISQAVDMSGLGTDALRMVPVEEATNKLNCTILREYIAEDRRRGLIPLMIVATAGTVDVGAVDDLNEIADIAQSEGIWLHIDGALGALAVLSPTLKSKFRGIDRADSIAFDFHKWCQVPYDAGFILMRDGEKLKQTFSTSASYLSRGTRGLNSGEWWPCDYGPDLSRGCRAVKTWFTLKVHGTDAIGAMMENCCRLASLLAQLVDEHPLLERLASVELNIVCFRFVASQNRSGLNTCDAAIEPTTIAVATTTVAVAAAERVPLDIDTVTYSSQAHDDRIAAAAGIAESSYKPTSNSDSQSGLAGSQNLDLDTVNAEIVFTLHEEGLVAPSQTKVRGVLAIRAAIVNHRTQGGDIHALVASVIRIGCSLTGTTNSLP